MTSYKDDLKLQYHDKIVEHNIDLNTKINGLEAALAVEKTKVEKAIETMEFANKLLLINLEYNRGKVSAKIAQTLKEIK